MTLCIGNELESAVERLKNAGVDSPLLDAQILMARALSCSRLDVIAHPECALTDVQFIIFREMIEKRESRYPLAYITGNKEFFSLDIRVAEGVLIPRPETEHLVEECLKRVKKQSPVIADVGIGSGAISIALAVNIPTANIYATEISFAAMQVAKINIENHQLAERVCIVKGDLLDPLIELKLQFDMIVSNPPYIPTSDIEDLEPEVRLYEPIEALDGGEDGLDVYRRLFPQAIGLLRNDGFVGVEIGVGQADSVRQIAKDAGYQKIQIIRDLAGIERVVIAYR